MRPRPARPVAAPSRVTTAAVQKPASPYKIVSGPAAMPSRTASPPARTNVKKPSTSVLRQASAEQNYNEPAEFKVDRTRSTPIVRSQSPETELEVPVNPLR
jgi:hypothetical protein